jgi:hypothetical protein
VFLVVWIAGTTSILWAYADLKRVRMDERQLYVSNYFREICVPFSAITDVKQNRWINSRPITIYFRDATQFELDGTFPASDPLKITRYSSETPVPARPSRTTNTALGD